MTRDAIITQLHIAAELHLKQFLLWAPVCLGLGIYLYFSIRFEPDFMLFLGIGTAGIAGILLGIFLSNLRFLFFAFALCCFGFCAAGLRAHSVEHAVLGWRYYGEVEGTVAFVDRSRSDKPRLTLVDTKMPPISEGRTPQKIRVTLFGKGDVPKIGQRIAIEASFSPPSGPVEPGGYDFRKRAWFQGLGAVGYARKDATIISDLEARGFAFRLAQTRSALSSYIRSHMSPIEGGFAAAILVGDRSFVDPTSLEELRDSNMAHLLAISGLHMGLLTGTVFAFFRLIFVFVPHYGLRWSSKKIAAILAIFAGASYLILSGSAVATERAFIMVAMMFGAILLDRPAITLRAVAMAGFVILLFWPENISEPGFQMSFAATIALVVVFRMIRDYGQWGRGRWGRLARNVGSLVLSSIVAGAATAPFAAYHFNQMAHFGVIANTLSLPVMGMVIMPSAIVAILLTPIGLQWLAFWIMEQGISWILLIAAWVAGFEHAISLIPQPPDWVLPAFVALCLCFVLMRSKLRYLSPLGLAVVLLGWQDAQRPEVLITDNGRMVGLVLDGQRSLSRDRGNGFSAEGWVENDGLVFDQEKLANLFPFDPDDFEIGYGDMKVGYLWESETPQVRLDRLCDAYDILIVPKAAIYPNGDCAFWNKRVLQRTGSIAIWNEGGATKLKTARQQTGARLWTDYRVRRRYQ